MKLLLVAVICFAAGYLVSSQFTNQGGSTAPLEATAEVELQSSNDEETQGSSVDQADEAAMRVDPDHNALSIADLTSQIGANNQVAIIFDTQHTPQLDVDSVIDALDQNYNVQKIKLASVSGSEYQAIVIFGFTDLREAEKAKPRLEHQLALRGIIRFTPACINDPPDDEGFVCSETTGASAATVKADP